MNTMALEFVPKHDENELYLNGYIIVREIERLDFLLCLGVLLLCVVCYSSFHNLFTETSNDD